jgi:hypothetical protein
VYWTKFERISGKIRRILTNYLCASHARSAREPKTKNFLTIPLSAGGVRGAGKKWKGKFLVLVPTLHSSRKDLYLYFSIVAIFCSSFPPSFALVRGAPVSAFRGNSSVCSHFATTSHGPFAFAHDASSMLRVRSVASFVPVVTLQSGLCWGTSKSICACPTHPVRAQKILPFI